MIFPAQHRLALLRGKMAEIHTDLVALGAGAHMDWLLGFHPHPDERPCLLLVGPQREAFLMPALNAQACRAKTDIAFYTWSDAEGPKKALREALAAAGAADAKAIVLDETMRADFALLVKDMLPGSTHAFTEATLGFLRMRKGDDEYQKLKANASINDRAMQAGFAALKPGIREIDVADVIKAYYPKEGARNVFCTVASGPNGTFPHYATGDRILQAGDAIVIDIGGTKDGYCSDMTRMAALGATPEGYDEVHAIVEAAVKAAMAAARPGVKARTVDEAARSVIADAGYGEYFVHRTGHGLGVQVHEPPYLTSTSDTMVEEGMVFSIEPGIYLPGRFGIRLEEIVILRADGPEILSGLPRDLFVVKG